MRTKLCLVLILLLNYSVVWAVGKRVALVIGNSQYQSLNPLNNPANDAAAVAEKLTGLGFKLIDRHGKPTDQAIFNLSEDDFVLAISQFSKQTRAAEMALVYYAGHGMQFGQNSYLLPIDIPKSNLELIRRNSIQLESILKMLDGKAKLTIAVFDACREIPELNTVIGEATRNSSLGANHFRGLARVKSKGRSRIVAYSGASGQLVKDGSGRHSPYTQVLLSQLDREGQEVGDIFRDVAYIFGQKNDGQEPEVLIQGVPSNHYYFKTHPTENRHIGNNDLILSEQYPLTVKTSPADARIRILNIAPKYQAGMRLSPGHYKIEVSRAGYQRKVSQFELDAEHQVYYVELAKLPSAPSYAKAKTINPDMVFIRGGQFTMGSPANEKGRDDDEFIHSVKINGFWLAKTEITIRQFREFILDTGYRTDANKNTGGSNGCYSQKPNGKWGYIAGRSWRNPGFPQQDQHPVVCVSWNDAINYTQWLSKQTGQKYRLPTEAEWEYAARAGRTQARYWGSDQLSICRFANVYDQSFKRVNGYKWAHNVCDDGYAHTAPVGHLMANDFHLYDMLGNVWEWTCSAYAKRYNGAEKHCTTSDSPQLRALRGGSWVSLPNIVRSALRDGFGPVERDFLLGFRVARSQ